MSLYNIVDREDETAAILEQLQAGQNTLLTGPFYRGKTTLLMHITELLGEKQIIPVYFNCMQGFTEQVFLELYSKQILKTLSFKLKSILEDSQRYLPNIRPKVNMSSIHGVDIRIDYNIKSKDIKQYLVEILDVPNKIHEDTGEKMVIILDEIQALLQLKDFPLMDVLIKTLKPGVSYIFCGSQEKDIATLIPKKLYEKLNIKQLLHLEPIPGEILQYHIEEVLQNENIKYTPTIVEKIISITRGEVAFTSQIVQRLIEKGKLFQRISLIDISLVIHEIVNHSSDIFYMYFDSLSTHQKNLIIAIALEGGEQIFKGDFIYSNGLVSVPSVQTSINALIKKNFVHKEAGEYRITNFFFKEWLKTNFL